MSEHECDLCGETFDTKSDLRNHFFGSGDVDECPERGQEQYDEEVLCDVCGEVVVGEHRSVCGLCDDGPSHGPKSDQARM